MQERKLLRSIVVGIAISMLLPAATRAVDTNRDNLAEILRHTELSGVSTKGCSDKTLEKIALLSKEVEARRTKYARTLSLYFEKIASDKDADQDRIDYEKAQIKLGGEWHRTKEVLERIHGQQLLLQKWEKEIATARQNAPAVGSVPEYVREAQELQKEEEEQAHVNTPIPAEPSHIKKGGTP